jgi:HK97 family phage major capsid protein
MKKKLMEILAKKEARKKELETNSEVSKDVTELRGINTELKTLNGEITELRGMIAEILDDAPEGTPAQVVPESRGVAQVPQGKFTPLASYGGVDEMQSQGEKRSLDAVLAMPAATEAEKAEMRTALFALPEYRTAYFKVLAGKKNLTDIEKRVLTTAADSGGAAVPTTTYDMIIKRMTQVSALFGLIKKTFIQGSVVLPVANAQTAAQWSDTATETVGETIG